MLSTPGNNSAMEQAIDSVLDRTDVAPYVLAGYLRGLQQYSATFASIFRSPAMCCPAQAV